MNTSYNFDELTDRRGTNSYKWDAHGGDGVLPMWVADMDFKTAPCIVEALHRRIDHAIFGYTQVPQEYFDAVISWFAQRHGWHGIEREDFIYTSGVVPAISAILKALTVPGDEVVVMTPSYNCFFSSIRNNKLVLSANLLVNRNGAYSIDWDDLERRCASAKAKVLLLCNPHNPVGRVWTREELQHIGEICLRHDVKILADEIHCEFTHPDHPYTPFATVDKRFEQHTVVCVAPTKAFNIAGLQIANIITKNAEMRRRIDRAINDNEVCDVNPFGVLATIAAYSEAGAEWLDQLNSYICQNFSLTRQFFAEHLPQFPLTPLEGTYLAWADVRATGMSDVEIAEKLFSDEKLYVNDGTMYGPGGEGFIRINLATQRARVEDGLNRIRRSIGSLGR